MSAITEQRTRRVFGKYMKMRERMEDLMILLTVRHRDDNQREYNTKSHRCEVIERYFGFTIKDRRDIY